MLAQLRYGATTDELSLPDEKLIGRFQGPLLETEFDARAAVRSALARPLEAPELHLACTPDDHVAIVLDPGTPQAADLLIPVIECLTQRAGILADRISIVYPAGVAPDNIDRLIDELPEEWADVQMVEHRPDDERSMAYLASTHSGQRVYLNRVVVDADIVFVIGRSGFDSATGRRGLASTLYPALSNAEALAQVRRTATESRQSPETLYLRQHCQEVAGLAGLFYGLAVSLDAHGRIERCWLGRIDAVERAAAEYADLVWTLEPPPGAPDLVVAVCSSSSGAADWSAAGDALESASHLLGPEGGWIVLVSDVAVDVGPAGQALRAGQEPWAAANRARSSNHLDSISAFQCASALAVARIFLLSGLSDDVVESLGIAPVSSMHEIENLVESVDTVFLLESADRVRVRSRKERLTRTEP